MASWTWPPVRHLGLLFPLLLPVALHAQAAGAGAVSADPPLDTVYPPSQAAVSIPSHGVPLNGLLYLPQGPGAHRVVVFVHGLPGVEKNLDLAQAVRRVGYAVLYFDYRGLWGTGGTFSFGHSLEDVAAALAWLRTPQVAQRYRLDNRRLVLVGHSFGGWLTLMTLGGDSAVACAAAFAPGNRSRDVADWEAHPRVLNTLLESTRAAADPQSGPIRARPEDIVQEIEAHREDWDLVRQVPAFRDRPLLLVTGKRDTPHMAIREDLRRALSQAGATQLRDVVFDDDHGFDASRIAAAQLLTQWLATDCRL